MSTEALQAGRDACLATQFGGADTYSTAYEYTFGSNGEQTGCAPISQMGVTATADVTANVSHDNTSEFTNG